MLGLVCALLLAGEPIEPLLAPSAPPSELQEPPLELAPLSAAPERGLDLPSEPPPLGPPQRRKNYLLASLETAFLFGTGTYWYWDRSWYAPDWDLHFSWQSWERKLDFDAVRFDADRFNTNAGSHPRAGLGYYQAARGNGLGFAESYLWVFVTSVLWEYAVEFNEFPSINDMIFTPQGGAVVGESTYRIGRFFDAGAPNVMNRVGAFLFSPFAVIDDLATGRKPEAEGSSDAFGFTRAIHHKFELGIDALDAFLDGKHGNLQALTVDSALVSHRSYRRPGRRWTNVGAGEWTELGARLLRAEAGGIEGVAFHSSTLFWGRYFRDYEELGLEEPWRPEKARGWGTMLGLGTAFDYSTRDLGFSDDRVASAGLLGPVAEIVRDRGDSAVRFAFASYYSFAMIDSLVYAAYGDPATAAAYEINTPLRQQGYYYGQGLSSIGSIVLRMGDFELALAGTFAAYWSINAKDRYEERLQSTIAVSDTRSSAVVAAGVRPLGGPVRLSARVEHYERTGALAAKSVASLETRAGFGAALVF
jgi:hypothetical protein